MCLIKDCYLVETGYWINKKKHQFTRNRIMPYRLLDIIVVERHNKGIFNTAYRYNTDIIDESYLYGDMYFDFDNKDDFEKVREDALKTLSYLKVVFKIQPEELKIYFSGNKGLHIIVPAEILGVEPNKSLNNVFKMIADNVRAYTTNKTLDLAIYDNKRLFRIPQSIHEATGLHKISITVEELRSMPHVEIKAMAVNKRYVTFMTPKTNFFANARYRELVEKWQVESTTKKKVQFKGTLKCVPPCIKFLLETGAQEGARNNTIAVLSSFYRNSGAEMNETMDKIIEWNNTLNLPPTKDAEIVRTVKSIYFGRKSYGCSSLKVLSECNEAKCPLKRKKGK